jgi:hypothetical protein
VSSEPLVCPTCATTYPLDERFCPGCRMPLVYAGSLGVDVPITERHERARKIKPQFTEGRLVRVAGASNQTEAEFIQGLLLEEGVPSTLQRTRGFDVPDMLAAGPRDVMVPQSGYVTARQILLESSIVREVPATDAGVAPQRVLAGLLAAVAVVAVIAWLGTDVLG